MKSYAYVSPATGKCVPIEAVYDHTLSSKALGNGVAIFPTSGEGTVSAPCDCVVSCVSQAKNAITILDTVRDIELLLCAEFDEEPGSARVSFCVEPGQAVRRGETLFTCDVEDIRAHGHQVEFPCIITNAPLAEIRVTGGDVVRGQSPVLSCEVAG